MNRQKWGVIIGIVIAFLLGLFVGFRGGVTAFLDIEEHIQEKEGTHQPKEEVDVRMWNQIRNAIKDCDVNGVNRLLRVDPGELVLVVRTCPMFPDGCNPIAEISVSNAANRLLTVFEPRVQRRTKTSYQYQNCMQDDYVVDCTSSTQPRWCRVLKPGQTLALSPTILTVDDSGPHQVNFALTCELFESISEHSSHSTSPVVARTVTRFELRGARSSCGERGEALTNKASEVVSRRTTNEIER